LKKAEDHHGTNIESHMLWERTDLTGAIEMETGAQRIDKILDQVYEFLQRKSLTGLEKEQLFNLVEELENITRIPQSTNQRTPQQKYTRSSLRSF